MKIIPHSLIKGAITPPEAFNLVKETFIRQREFLMPPKISIKYATSNFFNTMPCIMPFEANGGVLQVLKLYLVSLDVHQH